MRRRSLRKMPLLLVVALMAASGVGLLRGEQEASEPHPKTLLANAGGNSFNDSLDGRPDSSRALRRQGVQKPGANLTAAASAVEPGPVKDALAEEWRAATARLKFLESCYTSQECGFSRETPASYSYAVQDEIISALGEFKGVAKRWQERTAEMPPEAQAVARHFLGFPEDGVKEAALALIAAAPASVENMRAVIAALETSVSAPLFKLGLIELARYADSGEKRELDAFLLGAIRQGGRFASAEVARASLDFITPENAREYAAALRELPTRSKSHHYLKLNLEEFVRMQRGG